MPPYQQDGSVLTAAEREVVRIMEQCQRIVTQQAKADHYDPSGAMVIEKIEEITQDLLNRFSPFERQLYTEAKAISDRYYPFLPDEDWSLVL